MLYSLLGLFFFLFVLAGALATPQHFPWRRPSWQPGVHALAVFTLGGTLGLLCLGGLVTSHEAGMAVPDWPNSFGYNMFLFPISQWVAGIFYEHTHRLWASGIGLLTLLLTVGIAWSDARAWLRWLGWLALILVIAQGVLGGLRVTLVANWIGIIHGTLAQVFFCLLGFLSLATSTWWHHLARQLPQASIPPRWGGVVLVVSGLIFLQLILGASMRHAHQGLAIPDFPTAYGQLLPPLDEASLAHINEQRLLEGRPDTSRTQILIHMAHRIGGIFIFLSIIFASDRLLRYRQAPLILRRGTWAWLGLVSLQVVLGAATVWSDKAADIATIHMTLGALILICGVLMAIMARRIQRVGTPSSFPSENSHNRPSYEMFPS